MICVAGSAFGNPGIRHSLSVWAQAKTPSFRLMTMSAYDGDVSYTRGCRPMSTVAAIANGGLPISFAQGLAVHTLLVVGYYGCGKFVGAHQFLIRMTSAAGVGYVAGMRRALRIRRRYHSMYSMTIGANGNTDITSSQSLSMNRRLIERHLICGKPVSFHLGTVRMTRGARLGNLLTISQSGKSTRMRSFCC